MASGCFRVMGSDMGGPVIAGCHGMAKMAGGGRYLLFLAANAQWQTVFVEVNLSSSSSLS